MGNGNVISYHTGAYASALCFTKPNIVSLFHIENQNIFCVWLLCSTEGNKVGLLIFSSSWERMSIVIPGNPIYDWR